MLQLEEAPHPIGINIIRNRGATQPDGMLEHLTESQAQPFQFGLGEAASRFAWPDAGVEEALIGIDVAYARQKRLIEQGGFDGQPPPVEESRKGLRLNGQRLFAGGTESRIAAKVTELKPAKTTGVYKTQFAATGQAQSSVRVGGNRRLGSGYQQPPGHAKMNDPLCLRLLSLLITQPGVAWPVWIGSWPQLADNVFPGPMHSQQDTPLKALGLPGSRGLERLLMLAKPYLINNVAMHPLMDATSNGFHLWQFRHLSIVGEG